MEKFSLLLAACCGPCATVALEELSKNYKVTIQFFGSNIHPAEEFEKRRDALLNLCPETIVMPYEPIQPETCEKCYKNRLRAAAEFASKNNFEYFATSLTTSPHKPAAIINQIGDRLSAEYNIKYLPTDFKKNNGFARSVALSKQLGLYRQNYCGCTSSIRPIK